MLLSRPKRNTILLLASSIILATVTAQDSTTAQDAAATSSAPPDPSPYPTAMIFLPGNLHGVYGNGLTGDGKNLAASVITAVSLIEEINAVVHVLHPRNILTFLSPKNENQTAYAISCMQFAGNATTPGPQGCNLQSTITVTAGESTLIYTYNPLVTTDDGM